MEHSTEEYQAFFQKQADYYLRQVERYKEDGSTSFSLFAFLFGFLWLLYRKQYFVLIMFFLIMFAWGFMIQLLAVNELVSYEFLEFEYFFTSLLSGSLLGILANRIYIKRADRKITKIKSQGYSPDETMRQIKKAGGVTLTPHLILVGIGILVVWMGQQGFFD